MNNTQEKKKAQEPKGVCLFVCFFCKDSECGLQSGAIAVVWGAKQVTMGPRQGDQGARRVGGAWDGLRSHDENDNREQ